MSTPFKQYYTEDGTPYYFDASTGRSMWAVPADWVTQHDEHGQLCFKNTVTGDIVPATDMNVSDHQAYTPSLPPQPPRTPAQSHAAYHPSDAYYSGDTAQPSHYYPATPQMMSPSATYRSAARPMMVPAGYGEGPMPMHEAQYSPYAPYYEDPYDTPRHHQHYQHHYQHFESPPIRRSHSDGGHREDTSRRERRRRAEQHIMSARQRSSTTPWAHTARHSHKIPYDDTEYEDYTPRRSYFTSRGTPSRVQARSRSVSDSERHVYGYSSFGDSEEEPWFLEAAPSIFEMLGCSGRGADAGRRKGKQKKEGHSAVAPSDAETGMAHIGNKEETIGDADADEFAKRFVGLTLEQRTEWLQTVLSRFGGSVLSKTQYLALYLTGKSLPYIARFIQTAVSTSSESWNIIKSVTETAMQTLSPKDELPRYVRTPADGSKALNTSANSVDPDSEAYYSAISAPNTADSTFIEDDNKDVTEKLFAPAVIDSLMASAVSTTQHFEPYDPAAVEQIEQRLAQLSTGDSQNQLVLQTPPRWPPKPTTCDTPSAMTSAAWEAHQLDAGGGALAPSWNFFSGPSHQEGGEEASHLQEFQVPQSSTAADHVKLDQGALPKPSSEPKMVILDRTSWFISRGSPRASEKSSSPYHTPTLHDPLDDRSADANRSAKPPPDGPSPIEGGPNVSFGNVSFTAENPAPAADDECVSEPPESLSPICHEDPPTNHIHEKATPAVNEELEGSGDAEVSYAATTADLLPLAMCTPEDVSETASQDTPTV